MMAISGFRRGWRVTGVALAVVALGLVLAAIHGGIASADGTSAEASRSSTVDIDNFAYHPPKLTIGVGSKVVFSNSSGTAHTATRRGSFDTGRIKPGRSVAVRFGRKGTFAYHCKIHPFMHGKIVVD